MIQLETILIVIGIIICHWIFDFVCQTKWMATNKSKNIDALLAHTALYSALWYIPILIYGCIYELPYSILCFPIITFICHTITDYYTSKAHKILWDNQEVHNFFVSIGFDQVLHYIQLLLIFYMLTR